MTSTPSSVSTIIVVPTYDEAGTIVELLDRVLTNADSDVLVVDDNSPDGTAALVRDHAAFGARVHVLDRAGKEGLGAAYRAGFAWAADRGYDLVVQMDADLSHPPEAIRPMLRRARAFGEGGVADVVIGSRYVRGGDTVNWPLSRQLISRGGNLYVALVLALSVRDATAGFRVYDAAALRTLGVLDSTANGYAFQIENTWRAKRAGLVVEEHPITFTERRIGQSKMTSNIVREAVLLVLRWRLSEISARLRSVRRPRRADGRQAGGDPGQR